jgi:translocation and assembly module TamA
MEVWKSLTLISSGKRCGRLWNRENFQTSPFPVLNQSSFRLNWEIAMHFFSFRAFLKAGFIGTVLLLATSGLSSGAATTLAVVVEGLEGEARQNVETALSLPEGLVKEDRVDELLLARFQEEAPQKVREALEPFGYYHPQLTLTTEHQADQLRLLVRVDPGPPLRVASVQVDVHGPGSEDRKFKDSLPVFPMKTGEVLRQDRYEEWKTAARDMAREFGYLDAEFSVHLLHLSLAENEGKIELALETGPRYTFGEVTFIPPLTFPEAFLRRYLAFRPGKAYSPQRLARTQLNFTNSDRFAEVSIESDKEAAVDYRVPIRIRLTPSKPKRLRFGVGYETDKGAGILARYQDLNFNRWGHEFHTELRLSERVQGFAAEYLLPGLRDLDSKQALKMGYKREITDTYDSRSWSSEYETVHSFGRGRQGSGYLRFLQEDFSIAGQDGLANLLIPGMRFWQRRYDDPLRPIRGYRYYLEARGSTGLLGADGSFLQLLPQGETMIPLGNGFSLLLHGQMGVTLQNEPLNSLPPSLRFFAGGDNSVRGYSYQSLGPKNSSGRVVGGKNLLVGTLEIEKAFSSLWGLAVFYDAGNAFDDFSQYELKQGAGIGLRLYTPLGPIRLDLARQIGETDNQFRVHFSVGFGL